MSSVVNGKYSQQYFDNMTKQLSELGWEFLQQVRFFIYLSQNVLSE